VAYTSVAINAVNEINNHQLFTINKIFGGYAFCAVRTEFSKRPLIGHPNLVFIYKGGHPL